MKRLYIICLLLLAAISVSAQQNNLRTAYFLDGYTYNYKLNPAFAPERGFFAFPVLGRIGAGVETNLALSDFLYPTNDGNLAFFLDDSVNDDIFLNSLKDKNMLNSNVDLGIIAFGFRTGKAFHTFDISLKVNQNANLPKDLFSFAKIGTSNGNTAWNIGNLGIGANAYAEAAYGYSRSFGESLRVGARLKFLAGVARADVMIDRLDLSMSQEVWNVTAAGHADISGPLTVGTKDGGLVDYESISFPEELDEILDAFKTQKSYGFAADLGVSYEFLNYFTASLSLLDLGMISWNNTTTAEAPGSSWKFDGFGTISESTDFDKHFEQLGEDLMDMIQLKKTGDGLKKSYGLAATLHAGIEARAPFYERLSLGLLATHRFNGPYSWTEGRLSANLAPVNCISMAASYAISNFGSSLGGVLNFHFPGFNLFLGLDSFKPLLNVTPQFIPIDDTTTNLAFGINFSFGKPQGRFHALKQAKKDRKKQAESLSEEY